MSTCSLNGPPSESVLKYFQAVETGSSDTVRELLTADKSITTSKHKSDTYKYDGVTELDAYKFLGAYLGSLTGLHLAILKGHDQVARDIIDATLGNGDLDMTFGGGNTALHLATLIGARDIVRVLLERKADPQIKNNKGFRPVDIADDPELQKFF